MGVVEVLQNGQAFAEGGLHWASDVLTAGVGNHALHASQGPNLTHVTGGTGLHDHRNWVVIWVECLDGLTDEVGGFLPQVNQGLVALSFVDLAASQLLLDNLSLGLVVIQNFLLVRQNQHVVHGDGHTGTGCPVETSVLELVHRLRHGNHWVLRREVVNNNGLWFLRHDTFNVGVVPWEKLVE